MTTTDPEAELARALAAAREHVATSRDVVRNLLARIQAADTAIETALAARRALSAQLGSGGAVTAEALAQAQAGINPAKDHAAALREARATANTAVAMANRELHGVVVAEARGHLGPAVRRQAKLKEELAVVDQWIEEIARALALNDSSIIELVTAKRPVA